MLSILWAQSETLCNFSEAFHSKEKGASASNYVVFTRRSINKSNCHHCTSSTTRGIHHLIKSKLNMDVPLVSAQDSAGDSGSVHQSNIDPNGSPETFQLVVQGSPNEDSDEDD